MSKSLVDETTRQYAGKSLAERHSERYDRLIEAGIDIIGKSGYAHTTVKAVCLKAGLTERYFYESFETREDLLAAVYTTVNEKVRDDVRAAMNKVVPEAYPLTKAMAETFFIAIKDDPRIARIVFFEAVERSGRLAELRRQVEEDFIADFKKIADNFETKVDLSDERLRLLMAGLYGAFMKIGMRWVLDDYRQSLDDVVESALVLYCAVLDVVWD